MRRNDKAENMTCMMDISSALGFRFFLRASSFGFRYFHHMCSITLSPNCEHPPSPRLRRDCGASSAKSHVVNDIISKFAALDFGCAVHQTREIVGHAFARDSTFQSFE